MYVRPDVDTPQGQTCFYPPSVCFLVNLPYVLCSKLLVVAVSCPVTWLWQAKPQSQHRVFYFNWLKVKCNSQENKINLILCSRHRFLCFYFPVMLNREIFIRKGVFFCEVEHSWKLWKPISASAMRKKIVAIISNFLKIRTWYLKRHFSLYWLIGFLFIIK